VDIKILVAAHKKYWMPSDPCYLPLHVGREGKQDLGYIGDNTGDNISSMNPYFCELTGIYWAWKNMHADYIGLCHYRRYFAGKVHDRNLSAKQQAILSTADYEKLLQDYDCLLPNKRNYYIETVRSQYEHAHNKRDLDECEKIIAEKYPEYSAAFTKIMQQKRLHILNMFVMKWELFDTYCQFLFGVLFELEKRIDISNYTQYEARVYGFLAERLLNVWIEKNQIEYKEVPVVFMEKINWLDKGTKFLKRKLSGGPFGT
jgi:hypothetical protein